MAATSTATQVWARVPFTYGGRQLDKGELFELRNLPRDQQLLGLRYMEYFAVTKHGRYQCPDCGRNFVREDFLYAHKQKPNCNAEPNAITAAETADLLERPETEVRQYAE